MKVLYISHFREGTGWAFHAQNNMLALDAAGVDVVARVIRLTPTEGSVHPRILELEEKSLENVTHIVQHVLPHHMEYISGYKNIAYFLDDLISNDFKLWYRKLALFDEIWVPNKSTYDEVRFHLNVSPFENEKIKIVPIPTDISEYETVYPKTNLGKHNADFIFYTIGDLTIRKNYKDTIRAFYTEFKRNEPVSLLIKVNKFNTSPNDIMQLVSSETAKIKNSLKLYPNLDMYPQEIIIAGHVSREEIMSYHETCDCFVNSSHGETWSMPMFDAYAMGNGVVCQGEYYDYIERKPDRTIYTYEADIDDTFGYSDTFFELGSANSKWFQPNIHQLKKAMRNVYEMSKGKKKVRRDVEEYSIESVGKLMGNLLNG